MANIKNLKLNYFFQAVVSFWIIALLSFSTATSMTTGRVAYTPDPVQSVYMPPAENEVPPYKAAEIDIFQFLVSFLIATAMMLAFLEFFKGRLLFEVFFSAAIIFGAQGPLGILFGKLEAFAIAVGIVILRFKYPRIWTQNFAIILGISGISASLGMSIEPLMAAVLLVILSAYDIIAVYKTRHMVKLFKGMAERGAILALVIPRGLNVWLEKFSAIKRENHNDFIFLGTGDLALPVFFAVSSMKLGDIFFFSIILGASAGFLADHLYFTMQKERKPIPALPFIALFSIIGYLLAFVSLNAVQG
ncbi:MAG: presenilin family intramembrane aspartyl protease [Candidatus Paceibacterota bacterium]|jgi:presenilin-like A22 family membrane protease